MNGLKMASALLRSVWLVDHNFAENNIGLAQSILDGTISKQESTPLVVNIDGRFSQYHFKDGWNGAKKDTLAFYDITGPILHYGWCNDGTNELNHQFKEAEENSNISGHFLFMDTPGGQADGVKEFAETIRNSSKPVVAFVNGGMIASGGVWIASAADQIFASSNLCEVGSIGAYSQLIDSSERDQRDGVKRITIRAKQSSDKNTVYELAKSGDENALAELQDRISVVAAEFISAVENNRKTHLKSSEWNTGKMYFAEEAISMGLIDGISTLEDAIGVLVSLTKNKKSNMSKFNNVVALAGQDQVSQEALDLANADLTQAGITHVTLVEQSVIDEGARVTAELATANSTIADQVAAIQEKDARIQNLESVIANRAKVDTGKAAVAGEAATKESEIKDAPPTKVAAHNLAADSGFFSSSTQSK